MPIPSHRRNSGRFPRSILLATDIMVLLVLLVTVDGSVIFPLSLQPDSTITSPPVFLQAGTAGSSTIYANNTSARVSSVAPRNWLSGWERRVKITIDKNDIAGALSSFPVLVHLSSSSGMYGDDVRFVFDDLLNDANRKKIAITTSDGTTQCYVEIEKWDTANKQAWLWTKVPSVSNTANTVLYLYYDRNQADNTGYVGDTGSTAAQNVWDSNFKGVWHLSETTGGSGALKDSTSNKNNGTNYGSPALGSTGQIDGAVDFDGVDDYISIPNSGSLQFTSSLTIEAWINLDSFGSGSDVDPVLRKGEANPNDYQLAVYNQMLSLKIEENDDQGLNSASTIPANTWYYVTGTWNGTTRKVYLNGSESGSGAKTGNIVPDTRAIYIGGRSGADLSDGTIDEVRASNTTRNASWTKASYETERDHLLDFGSEELRSYYPTDYNILSGNWRDLGWGYRKRITVNHAQVQANLTGFPVLINLTSDGDLVDHAQSNGNDILLTSSNGITKLSHEIEKYNGTTGALVAWVKVPSLSSSVDTDLYMYYGNPTCGSQQDVLNVWDSNFKGIWHLKENPSGTAPQMKDSTSNGNNGTSSGSMTTSDQVAGKIDGSLDFDGSNDEVQCGNAASLQITTAVTIEAWVKRPSTTAIYAGIAGKLVDGTYRGYCILKHDVTNQYRFGIGTGTGLDVNCVSDSAYTDTNWHYIVGVRRAGTNYLYVDGVQQTATSTQAITDSGANFDIGRQYSSYNGRWWSGIIDEVRVSNTGRNASWIATCYNNQITPSAFYSVCAQEENPKVSGTVPASLQTVDSNYFVVRSTGPATSTTAYNPSGYNLIGSTTFVSGATSDLTSDNGVYMTFRSYTSNDVRYAESLGQSGTTSTTYQDKVTLTFTPPVAGDYIIIADAEVQGSSTFYNSLARLYIGTSTYQELIRSIKDTGDWYPFNALKRLSLSAATTMTIQFRSSNAAATASIRNARLIALRVSSEYAESEGRSTTTSTSWQNKVTLTFTPATAGDYLIIATSNVDGSSTSYDVEWRLLQDSATVHANVVKRAGAAAGRYNAAAMRMITLSASSHNFTIQYRSSSTFGTAGISYAHVIAIRVDQFPNNYYQESEGESSPAVAGTWYDKVTSTYTPQTGDHLIIGTIHHTSASTLYSVGIRLDQNGVTATDRLNEQTATTDYEASFSFTKASLTATSTTDALQYMGESTATAVKMARILSLRLFEQIIEVEFTGSSNTEAWNQFVWSTDTAWTAGSVAVTIQAYNYTLGGYPTSGNGYISYTSSSTASADETRTQTITTNPTHFRNASGNWKMKVKGVKTTTEFDLKVDWIEFKPTHYSNLECTVSTEFLFSSMTANTPSQLNFTVVSEYNTTGVSVTIQVWNYSSSTYVTSGQGYLTYSSSGSNETKLLSINTNPQFHASNGSARVKLTGVKTTTTQYQQKANQIKLLYTYNSSSNYNYVLKIVNQVSDTWKIRLKAYSQSGISRLNNCTIYFRNASDGTSRQIYIQNGAYVNQTGSWYDLQSSPTEKYIAMTLQATDSTVSVIYVYLEILVPNKTTYSQYVITFEIT